jgi:hypothetical protein
MVENNMDEMEHPMVYRNENEIHVDHFPLLFQYKQVLHRV